MSGIYYVDLIEVLEAHGVAVQVEQVNMGWETRARSSGGFAAPPLAVFWHHTASRADPHNDLAYMINGSPDAPVGNVLIDRDGIVWPIAAGASNCAGKGGPATFSRGTIPADSGNSQGWQIEVANDGVGEPYPKAQIDALVATSNALNARFGNRPDDVITHSLGAGDGWTDRKIDPATSDAVEGSWRPLPTNSSGTWSLADIRAECLRRSDSAPPVSGKDITMYVISVTRHGWPGPVDLVVDSANTRWNSNGHTSALDKIAGVPRLDVDKDQTLGLLLDRPGTGPCPFVLLAEYADADLAW